MAKKLNYDLTADFHILVLYKCYLIPIDTIGFQHPDWRRLKYLSSDHAGRWWEGPERWGHIGGVCSFSLACIFLS